MAETFHSLSSEYKLREEFFGGLLFCRNTGRVREINRTGFLILKQYLCGLDPVKEMSTSYRGIPIARLEADASAFLENLKSQGILSSEGGGGVYLLDWNTGGCCLSAPRSVFWEITGRCNISTCIHCYSEPSSSVEMGTETALSLVRQLEDCGVFTIDIGGGEPFLRDDLAKLINLANDGAMRCNVATNLSMPPKVVEQRLKEVRHWEYNSLQVSLDGDTAELHDAIRGKTGCFQSTYENVRLLHQSDLEFHINCTVMKRNLPRIRQVVETALDWGSAAVRFVRLIPAGRGRNSDLTLEPQEYRRLFLMLRDLHEEFRKSIDVRLDESFSFLESPAALLESMRPKVPWLSSPYVGCGAARTLMAIASNGDVYPCAYLRHLNFRAGSALETPLKPIWRHSQAFRYMRTLRELHEPCCDCRFRDVCLGGCRAAAWGEYNDIQSGDPGCWKSDTQI